jgi:hypothetical protein
VLFPNRDIGHDVSFPELGAVIGREYDLVQVIDDVRVYVRRNRLGKRNAEMLVGNATEP